MSWHRRSLVCAAIAVCSLAAVVAASPAHVAQSINANDLYVVRLMLHEGYDVVKKNYYDPKYHGLDWDARFKEFDAKLKTAASLNAGVAMVAAFLDGLQDSHTYFSPPRRPYRHDYGYRVAVVGGDVMITRVLPGTDAETKVRPGDRLVSLNGNAVTRDSLFSMEYFLNILSPQASTRLVLRDPVGAQREVLVNAKVVAKQQLRDLTGAGGDMVLADLIREDEASDHLVRQQFVEMGDVMIWKMPRSRSRTARSTG